MKCFNCDQSATLVNHTQFAGIHYWCETCVPKEDLADCAELWPNKSELTTKLNPLYIQIEFKEHFNSGFQLRPHELTCQLTYSDPKLPQITTQATAKTHHKAKAQAYKQLKQQFEAIQQQTLQNRFEDRAANLNNNHSQADRAQYLLDKLQEEAAEIIQAVSKIRRFGKDNHHPDRETTNLQELTEGLEDFQAIQWALEEIKYLVPKPSTTSTIKKYQTLISS